MLAYFGALLCLLGLLAIVAGAGLLIYPAPVRKLGGRNAAGFTILGGFAGGFLGLVAVAMGAPSTSASAHEATRPAPAATAANADADAKAWVDDAWKRAGYSPDGRATVAYVIAQLQATDPALKAWKTAPFDHMAVLPSGAWLVVDAAAGDRSGSEFGAVRYIENDDNHAPAKADRVRAIDDTVAALGGAATPSTIGRIKRALSARDNDLVEIKAGRIVFQVGSDRSGASFRAYIDR